MSSLQKMIRVRSSGGDRQSAGKRRRKQRDAPTEDDTESGAFAAAPPPAPRGGGQRVFHGLYSAVVTPMAPDGSPLLSAIEPYAALLQQDGVNGAFVNGTAGGSMNYSVAERKAVLAEWCRVGPRYGQEIIAHIGAQSMADSSELARHAEQCGAVGISAMAPCFFKPASVSNLVDFFAGIAAAAPRTPFIYYHFPEITGVNFTMAQVFKEMHPRVPTLRGAKVTNTNMWDLGDTIDFGKTVGKDYDMLMGYEGMTTSVLPLGITAHIGIAFSIVGPVWNRLVRAYDAGDHQRAAEEQAIGRAWFKMFADISGLWSMASCTKYMLGWRLGLDMGDMRPPQKKISAEHMAQLKVAWADFQAAHPGLHVHAGSLRSAPGPSAGGGGGGRDATAAFISSRLRAVAAALGCEARDLHDMLPHLKQPQLLRPPPADYSLADYVDHTLLAPDATKSAIHQLCDEAARHQFKAVCVNSSRVPDAVERLRGSSVAVAAAVGFPLGAMDSQAKGREAAQAAAAGAAEVDFVINVGQLKDGNLRAVLCDIEEVCKQARQARGGVLVKVILETCLLTKEQIADGCVLSVAAGADFVKTSTGFSKAGATPEAVDLMKAVVGDACLVKASGGIRDATAARRYIAAGVSRLGTSSGVKIVTGGTANGY